MKASVPRCRAATCLRCVYGAVFRGGQVAAYPRVDATGPDHQRTVPPARGCYAAVRRVASDPRCTMAKHSREHEQLDVDEMERRVARALLAIVDAPGERQAITPK